MPPSSGAKPTVFGEDGRRRRMEEDDGGGKQGEKDESEYVKRGV